MAKLMHNERKELFSTELVMVPSFKSNTGWRYVKKEHLANRQKEILRKLPGVKHKLNPLPKEPLSKSDVNA